MYIHIHTRLKSIRIHKCMRAYIPDFKFEEWLRKGENRGPGVVAGDVFIADLGYDEDEDLFFHVCTCAGRFHV